jgi:hypothetical protein
VKLIPAAVAALLLPVLLAGCGSMLPAPAVGIGTVTGTVVIAPCRPVERVGDPPCPPRPGIKVHFEQGSSAVATAVTDAAGAYRASLPAGAYEVWAEGGIGRAPGVRVTVAAGQTVTLNLNVDSGIR